MRGELGEGQGKEGGSRVAECADTAAKTKPPRSQAHQLMALEAPAGAAKVSIATVDAPKALLVDTEPSRRFSCVTERLPQLDGSALQLQN